MVSILNKYTVFLISIVFLQFSSIARAATAVHCENAIAIAISIQGIVEEKKENQWSAVKRDDIFCAGDIVRTRKNSRAILRLTKEQTNIALAQHTTISFGPQNESKPTWLELLKGAANFISRVPQSLNIKTPYVNAAIEGTEFLITVKEDHSEVSVFEGHVALSNENGKLDLKTGETGIATEGQAPTQSIKVNPVDAVQWTMYYPPIISKPTVSKQKTAPDDPISPTFENNNDPTLLTYSASQFLAVGRVEQAEQHIEKALSIDRGDSNALALKSIIAIVKNDKESALNFAKQAVENNQSAAAHIALSYAHQAHFDLTAALDAAKQATKTEPDNGIAWARLAELWLSQGDLDRALSAAEKATKHNPELAHTQTILGFSYLTKINTEKAKKAFEKAITLDQAAPLPHLGLGLAMIREGHLEPGRVEIEAATSLDPRNSLIRSYVGKAYYEEKRNDLAAEQFALAKQLDPRDPTPWFYDAIRKQTENDPINALSDLEKSKELNENRAVFRSQLLLDKDEAARNTNQARIYQDLGFDQQALLEGWKALNNDPTNHSAHRFLSDSYASLPRHEIARVSELLQAQLLQPVNSNPIQPSLSESNLGIFEGTGLISASLNEYNPLFSRNRFTANEAFLVGGNNTYGAETIFSSVFNDTVITAGGYTFNTDGFRANNDKEITIGNVFVQTDLSHNSSIQTEFRSFDSEIGDTSLRFDPTSFSPNLRQTEKSNELRIGFKQKITNKSVFLASLLTKDIEFNTIDAPAFNINTKRNGNLLELQNIYFDSNYKFTFGINNSNIDNKASLTLPFISVTNSDIRQANAYFYSNFLINKNLSTAIGGSYESFDGIDKIKQFNPKFGLAWNLNRNTSIRVASIRTLQKSLIANKTIEPTNIAGFNQFFDDATGTDATLHALALDKKISKTTFLGIEISKRELTVPRRFIPRPPAPQIPQILKSDLDEELARLYFSRILSENSTINLEYLLEKFERDQDFIGSDFFLTLKTQRLPIRYNYNRTNGMSFQLTTTFIKQIGNFSTPPFFIANKDKDDFWVTDATIRLALFKNKALISLSVKNVFDENFNFQDTDPSEPAIYPQRLVTSEFSILF